MKFEEFENLLKQTILEFKEIDKFGFIGFMGSLKIENDLDLVIVPNFNIKKGEFLKSLCNFLESLQKKCKNKKSKLICFQHSIFQDDIELISKRKKTDVFLHIVSFPDLVPVNEEVINNILKVNKSYFGDRKNLKNVKTTSKDYYYNYLFFINCLYSNYPKKLEDKKMHKRINYIFKHNEKEFDTNNKSNKELFFECCDFLDKISNQI